MPDAATTVPAVVDALVAAFDPIAGLTVVDGPTPIPGAGDLLQIAVGNPAVTPDRVAPFEGMGTAQFERYQIRNMLWVRKDNSTYSAIRLVLDGYLQQMRAVLVADKTLGGACMWASLMTDSAWTPSYAGQGKSYRVAFVIDVRASVP